VTRAWLGRLILRFSPLLLRMRQWPVLGPIVQQIGRRLLPPDTLVWTQVKAGPGKGLWLRLNPRTGSLYFRGGGEAQVQEYLALRLKPGMVFYDVGANIGLFTLIAARLVRPGGHVVAFEPEAGVAVRLQENAVRNELHNVTVVRAAAWSSSGRVSFCSADPSNSPDLGVGRVVDYRVTEPSANTVSAVALDDCISKYSPPDLIKCDVEGAEVEVFRGASQILAAHKPEIICELHSPECRKSVTELLCNAGYRVELLDHNHISAVAS
jgi:FkbM family methyltransferase